MQRANTYPAPRFLYSTQLPKSPGQPHTTNTTTTTTQNVTAMSPRPAAPTMTPNPPQQVPRTPGLVPHDQTVRVPATPATGYLPPSSSQSSPPITPRTNEALNTIHRLLTRTTTYTEHFPGQQIQANNNGDGNQKNILRLDYSLRSCVSQRPWTSESRGKYCRRIPMSPRVESESDNVSEADSDRLGDSDGVVLFSLLKGAESHKKAETQGEVKSHKEVGSHNGEVETHIKAVEDSQNEQIITNDSKEATSSNYFVKIKGHGRLNMVDSSTQTEEEYFVNTATPNAPLPQLSDTPSTTAPHIQLQASQPAPPQHQAQAYKLPRVNTLQSAKKVTIPSSKESSGAQQPSLSSRLLEASSKTSTLLDTSQLVRFPSAKRPLSAIIDSLPAYNAMLKPQHVRSYSADASYVPHIRTAQATRRLMTLYNGFNRSEMMRKFHEQYPEKVPDLREYSIREGKRHVICGSHAYYFH